MTLSKAAAEHLDAASDKAGMREHAEHLRSVARPCVGMHYGKTRRTIAADASRTGGVPHLPDSVEWPAGIDEGEEVGLAGFLAQINLEEVPDPASIGFPEGGHLWFFCRHLADYDPPVVVIHRDAGEKLKKRPRPSKDEPPGFAELSIAPLTFSPRVSLPLSSKVFERRYDGRGMDKLVDALGGDLDSYGGRSGIDGQLGGYSFQCEIDLARELALEQLGKPKLVNCDYYASLADFEKELKRPMQGLLKNDSAKQERYRKTLEKKRAGVEWIEKNNDRIQAVADSIHLLAMFRPDLDVGLAIGDGMFLDFLIDQDALAARAFDKVECRMPMLL